MFSSSQMQECQKFRIIFPSACLHGLGSEFSPKLLSTPPPPQNWRPFQFQRGRKEDVSVACRETREGWPLLTVETEVNGEWGFKEFKSFLGWFVGLVVPVQEMFVLPWLL
jgi:hypothetical protein